MSTIRHHWADFRGGWKSDDGKDRKDRTHEKVTTKKTHPRASLSWLSWQPGEPLRALRVKDEKVKDGMKQVL